MSNDIVTTVAGNSTDPWRQNYLDAGRSVQYAPGYYAYQQDPFVLKPHYNDQSIYAEQRKALMDPAGALQRQIMLYNSNYLSSKDDVTGLWSDKVNKAMAKAMSDANSMYMSLDDYLMLKSGSAAAGRGGSGGGGGGGGPRTSTSVNRSVRITSRATAQSLLKQTLTNELGREPSAAEIAAFVRSLNKAEKANPTVSTTTTTINGSNSSSSTVTKESQIDPGSEAETYAEKVNPSEAHRYQSGNYYDVIARMVGG